MPRRERSSIVGHVDDGDLPGVMHAILVALKLTEITAKQLEDYLLEHDDKEVDKAIQKGIQQCVDSRCQQSHPEGYR